MTFARAWLRLELRRRWRSLAVLALLVAIAVGVVVTALAAARRGASALTRLQARTLPATVDVLPNTPGFDWSKVRALPEVASFSNFVVDYTLRLEGVSSNGLDFPFLDDAMQSTMERPVILAGRAIDQRRVDEVLVTPQFVDTYHEGVGSTFGLDLPSAKQLDASFAGSDPRRFAGPRVTLHVVGVGISPWFVDAPDLPGGIQLSPALSRRYRAEIAGTPGPQNTQFINALVRLRHGAADASRFRDDLARITGRDDIFVGDLLHDESVIQRTIAFESRCLVAFALAALLAALFLVGQAVARYAASSATEVNTLRGLGLTPRGAVVAASAAPLVSGALGAVLGAVGAYFASTGFPFGTAYYYETSRGRSLDLPVSAGAILLAVVLVGLGAAGAARRAVRTRTAPAARSVIAAGAVRSGLPVPVVIGTRFALERGTGRSAVPVRPALVGSVVGVLGTIAAFTFSHAVSDAAHDPVRFGVNWRLVAFVGLGGHDFAPTAAMYHALAANPEVTAVADSRTAVATNPAGTASIALWEFENRPKPIHIVLLSGRPPRGPDEIALAPRTLSELHANVGGTVALRGNRGHRYRIVGSALVPAGPHNEYADGGWVTTAGYDTLFTGFKFHIVLIQTAHAGPDEAKQLMHSIASAVKLPPGVGLVPPDGITEAVQLHQVEVLPVVLGSFLALLAIGAVGHALAAAVRRRSRDLAVLRAVGMTPRQCRLVVVTHATVLALFGLAFGVPLGIAAGRTVWRAVAAYTPIEYVSPLAGLALVLVGPVAILLANLLAAWPGHRAGRLQVAQVLRAE